MWSRRDLRAGDNAALLQALRACDSVHAAFVFDTAILDGLPRAVRRVEVNADVAPFALAAAGITLGQDYPPPHALAREETLRRYAVVKVGWR
jgi:deoxyribodipyrimidine photolyase